MFLSVRQATLPIPPPHPPALLLRVASGVFYPSQVTPPIGHLYPLNQWATQAKGVGSPLSLKMRS